MTSPGRSGRPSVTVEAEETITSYVDPRNGSGPLWNAGSPMLVRNGDDVFVSISETGPPSPPMTNTRWQLWQRGRSGWELQWSAVEYREREPCPLAQYGCGRLFLSVNPSIDATDATTEFMGGPVPEMQYCAPHLLEFDAADPKRRPSAWMPRWPNPTTLKDHSYRGIAVDPAEGELFVFNKTRENMDYAWSFLDASGRWSSYGRSATPINACYPLLALRARAAHAVTIGDIIEPVKEWLDYKLVHQKRRFFFVFRRVFYTWTPDIAREQFAPPIEVDTVDDTAGHMWNLDLWLDASGRAHLLNSKRTIASELMRDRFFPGQPIVDSLEYCVVDKGEAVKRSTLARSVEGEPGDRPTWARFHATPEGRLYVIAHFRRETPEGEPASENRICAVSAQGEPGQQARVPLREAFTRFFTATERGGSDPSRVVDVYGCGEDRESLRYARLRIAES